MAETRDHYALVPSAEPGAVLAMRGRGHPQLPRATGRPGAAGARSALREIFTLDAPYLRAAGLIRDEDGEPLVVLHELDAPEASWLPPDGLHWLALDDADPVRIAPAPLRRYVADWLAVQQGAPVSELRPPWSRPGWFAEAETWVRESATAAGFELSGSVELRAQWPLSSVLRIETRAGYLYFKAVFPVFIHEPAMTVALAERDPRLVTTVVAVDGDRGWMLMRALTGSELGDQDVSLWAEGLRAMSCIQHRWLGREADLIELGAVDRRLHTLAGEVAAVAGAVDLDAELRSRFDAAIPAFEVLCETLAEGPLPETLVHGDLHPWNVMRSDDDLRIFDWSDSCVAHPLFDLATFLPRTDDVAARESMREAFLETWGDIAPLGELRALAESAAPLAQIHHAASYLRILDALEPDDRWYFSDMPRSLLATAVDLLDELRRARGI